MDAKNKDEEKSRLAKRDSSPNSKSPRKYTPLEKVPEEKSFFLVSVLKSIWNFKAGLYMMITGIAW